MSRIKFKKPLSIMLSVIMMFSLIPLTAFSYVNNTAPFAVSGSAITYKPETQAGNAAEDTSWFSEQGREFTLTTEEQLRGFASLVNSGVSFEGKTVYLGNDIDITGGDWTVIGNGKNNFYGTFDGKNHKVEGFFINISDTSDGNKDVYPYQGFFGYLGKMSAVKNLRLEGIVADGKEYCGILAGYADDYCTISNCTVNGRVTVTDKSMTHIWAGGLAGSMGVYSIISGCVNNASVEMKIENAEEGSPNIGLGGMAGALGRYGSVTSCTNNGNVLYSVKKASSDRSPMLGGIVGDGEGNIKISQCVNNGNVSAEGVRTGYSTQASLGGISGTNGTAVIEKCKNTGKVSCSVLESSISKVYAGGISGGSNGASTAIGNDDSINIQGCINTGDIEVIYEKYAVYGEDKNAVMAGGIVGGTGIMLDAITDSGNSGNVSFIIRSDETANTNNSGVGGIIGSAFNLKEDAVISKCYNTGKINGNSDYVGGVAGRTAEGLLVSDCYNAAAVDGSDYVGGIAGNLSCTLRSVFNYGDSITSVGSNAGFVAGSIEEGAKEYGAYYLQDASVSEGVAPADGQIAKPRTARQFKAFDAVYELNTADYTSEDRGIWKQGSKHPEISGTVLEPFYELKAMPAENGKIQINKQYLKDDEEYKVTFTPAEGYVLKKFNVKDMQGNYFHIYFNGLKGGVYDVTLKDVQGNAYDAVFGKNELKGIISGRGLIFEGEFAREAGTGEFKVTLHGNGGWWESDKEKTSVSFQKNRGDRLTRSDALEPEGYKVFTGWYTDEAGTVPFNFSSVISEDIDLYAKWDPDSKVVYYILNGGNWNSKDYASVKTGGHLDEPDAPEKAGYKFTGWYTDEACLYPFDLKSTAINGDITLYAGWVPQNTCQVILDPNGGNFENHSPRVMFTVNSGGTIGSGADSQKASNGGKVLRGWYTSPAGGSKWPSGKVLTDDVILYAHWDEQDGTPAIYPGTENLPMEIEDLRQLSALRDNINKGNSYEGCYFMLSEDISLPAGWVPMGALAPGAGDDGLGKNIYPFSGVFDGGGKTVNVAEGGLPLFNYVREAKIQNLNIYGKKIAGYGLINNYTTDYGIDGDYNVGTGGSFTEGCPDTVDIIDVTLKSGSATLYSGFIGGYASGGNTINIYSCTVESGVVIGYGKSENHIGSFVGWYSGTIDNCVSYASVYGNDYVGGLAGQKGQSMGFFTVKNSAFYGKVTAAGNYAGGIVGGGYDDPTAPNTPCVSVISCQVTGSVEGSDNVGGIFGGEPVSIQAWANGAGYIQNNCFTGSVKAARSGANTGAIIGYMRSMDRYNIIENNYYPGTASLKGIGKIEGIDYKSSNYGRTEPFAEEEACIPANPQEFASGKIAALLNSGNNSSKAWAQSGGYPVLGTAETAVYAVKLDNAGAGTVSVTGITAESTEAYQKAGSTVEVSAEPEEGYRLVRVNVLYEDGTSEDITSSKKFTMKMQNATVNVVFANENEKYAESIAVGKMPYKTSYNVGDSLDLTGLTFTVTYSDGTAEAITATPDMVSGFGSETTGPKDLTITYQGVMTTFTVTVNEKATGNINVSFRLIGAAPSDGDIDLGDGDYKGSGYITWIKTKTYKLKKGSTVYDLFTKALDDAGIDSLGADKNYVRTIYSPPVLGGYELSEFTNGKYSGWMYTVNGNHPNEGLQYWKLKDGDQVIWHYVNDYRYEVNDWFSSSEYPSLGNSSTWSKWLDAADESPKADAGKN